MEYNYDVCLSFAGENRDYVKKVAEVLHELGLSVFYDDFEDTYMWGKDLYTYLEEVYFSKSRFCVIFISKYYKEKAWTNHKRESAQARALYSHQEYILPARFDLTEIPSFKKTTKYIDLTKLKPE